MNVIINLYRNIFTPTATGGVMVLNDTRLCHTQEDAYRGDGLKIQDETCIPAIKYKTMIRWSEAFQRDVVCLYTHMINGVPTVIYNGVTYTYIYFHGGNHVNNTSGCVLTAYKRRSNDEIYSTSERAVFYPIRAALDVGDTVTIDIQNDFEDIHQYRWKG